MLRLVPMSLLVGCAYDPSGTWMFTLTYLPATGNECSPGVTHNFVGSYPPAEDADEDWTESADTEYSDMVFFGRLEDSQEGPILIVGAAAMPGTHEKKDWTFSWTRSQVTTTTDEHSAGYSYEYTRETTSAVVVDGSIKKDLFIGTWAQEDATSDAWSESDTWSDEVLAYVPSTGQIPAASYLLRTDDTGTEVPAYNDSVSYDCGNAGCTLTVNDSCVYSYELAGVLTDFEPDDSRWTEDAGQPAGDP